MIGTSEKRGKDAEEFDQKIKIVIVDIEGTTTSISYVKDTLFPYIRENVQLYLKNHWKEPEFEEDLTLLRKQAESDKENGVEGLVPIPSGNDNNDELCEAVLNNILWQMDLDRKTKALKQLQGHVMREGYMNGKLKGHVYDDVQPALKSWTHSGRQVYVYSSGSVAAQKLLFGFSEKGDLLQFFSGHFDTDVGPKVESSSYSNIAKQLNCKSEEIMFLTDIPKEAMAAREAGLHAILVDRPGNAPLSDDDCQSFRVIKSFDDIVFEVSAKRTKLSVDQTESNNTVIDASVETSACEMEMEVDDESAPKVSEEATVKSDSIEENVHKKTKATLVENGKGEEQIEKSEILEKDDGQDVAFTDPEESNNTSCPQSLIRKDVEANIGVKDCDGDKCIEIEKGQADSTTKTENSSVNQSEKEFGCDEKKSGANSLSDTEIERKKTGITKSPEKKTETSILKKQDVSSEESNSIETPESQLKAVIPEVAEKGKTDIPIGELKTVDSVVTKTVDSVVTKTAENISKTEEGKEKQTDENVQNKTGDAPESRMPSKTESTDSVELKSTSEKKSCVNVDEMKSSCDLKDSKISSEISKDDKVPESESKGTETCKETKSSEFIHKAEPSEEGSENCTVAVEDTKLEEMKKPVIGESETTLRVTENDDCSKIIKGDSASRITAETKSLSTEEIKPKIADPDSSKEDTAVKTGECDTKQGIVSVDQGKTEKGGEEEAAKEIEISTFTEDKMKAESNGENVCNDNKRKDEEEAAIAVQEKVIAENGGNVTAMETSATSVTGCSSEDQKGENSSEKENTMGIDDGVALDSSSKKDEPMETDGQDSVDQDSPIKADSLKNSVTSSDNEAQIKKETKNFNDQGNKLVDSNTNGINNDNEPSSLVKSDSNETDSKIKDSENIKVNKTEEPDTAKLSSTSAQS